MRQFIVVERHSGHGVSVRLESPGLGQGEVQRGNLRHCNSSSERKLGLLQLTIQGKAIKVKPSPFDENVLELS